MPWRLSITDRAERDLAALPPATVMQSAAHLTVCSPTHASPISRSWVDRRTDGGSASAAGA